MHPMKEVQPALPLAVSIHCATRIELSVAPPAM